jgi:hypothetical protein
VKGLRVLVDGAPMAEEQARALWTRFSAYMEEHRGDLAGFAAAEGFASVHPEIRDGAPVLVASRTALQRTYANAPVVRTGSPTYQGGQSAAQGGARKKHRKTR